jgi:DNA polymerase-3 subunit alpha
MQLGFSKTDELVNKCVENNYPACGIADLETISGAIDFFKVCKSKKIKPILGCSFFNGELTLFARNRRGWDKLIEILSTNSFRDIDSNDIICIINEDFPNSLKVSLGVDGFINDGSLKRYYYVNEKDSEIHRIVLASKLKLSSRDLEKYNGEYSKFFTYSDFYVPTKDQVSSSPLIEKIVSMCEDYDILSNPILPTFPTPNKETEEDYLKHLCREGWVSKLRKKRKVETEEDKEKYVEEFHKEFNVFKKANLFGYFLIVWDILDFIKRNGWLAGPGRGSAAGCLISYLIGITKIDPLDYDLLFERFYNESRNTEGNISLPDIDIDVPSDKRDLVIAYLKDKYGHENVGQMITLMRYQGRSALKEVLSFNEACGFAEMNAISQYIPDEAAISDELEKMDEEERSIIRWALINRSDELKSFCYIDENGNLTGDYAIYFDQAIRLEGTFKTTGTHAAGVVISKRKLKEVCPVKNGIAQFEMSDLEAIGQCKIDVLGVAVLSKLMYVEELNEKNLQAV